jgi:hypothetical protein
MSYALYERINIFSRLQTLNILINKISFFENLKIYNLISYSEKSRENVTLYLASFTYFNLNVDILIVLKNDEGAELDMGLRASPPELFMDDECTLMEMSEETHGREFGNLLSYLDYGLDSTMRVEDCRFEAHTTICADARIPHNQLVRQKYANTKPGVVPVVLSVVVSYENILTMAYFRKWVVPL